MNRSYSKIRHIQESNQILEKRVMNEQIVSNVSQLVKDVIGFIWNMKIVPGPVDAGKLLYDLVITSPAGVKTRVVEGIVIVTPGVSQ